MWSAQAVATSWLVVQVMYSCQLRIAFLIDCIACSVVSAASLHPSYNTCAARTNLQDTHTLSNKF